MNIQITGASGSGKTFLGKRLSKILNYNFIDTDDILWLWDETVKPYTVPLSEKDACNKLKEELLNNDSTIASGMFYPWSESLISQFDLLIILETDKEIRRKRIIDREREMYGDRFLKGGDMYNQFNDFLNWSMDYDISNDKLGSKIETNKWASKFKCDVLYIDGALTIDEKVSIVLKKMNEINNKSDNIIK